MAAARLLLLVLFRMATRIPVVAAVVIAIVFTAPGFHSDERSLQLSAESLRTLDAERPASAWEAGRNWLTGALHGDLGESTVFRRPVTQLLSERIAVTARSTAVALTLGWLCAVCALAVRPRAVPGVLSAAILCTPAALLAFFAVVCRLPADLAVATVVFARAHTWVRRIHADASAQPWAVSARAFGLSRVRIVQRHVLPHAWPQLAAVMAASVTLAIGTAVPVEVICDSPGIGQLAWRATLGRDLPLLLAVTLCIASCTIAASCIGDTVGERR